MPDSDWRGTRGWIVTVVEMLGLSAIQMAAGIRAGDMSSVELVRAHLDRIAEMNGALNAAVAVMADEALQAAERADAQLRSGDSCGLLQGVPFSVKDSIDVRGWRTTAGTLGRRKAGAAEQDATLVKRLREAGGIPIAKTNLPDLLFAFESDNLIFGRTNNPYDLSRTAGGSSGGEAALIAAAGSPLGLGSDAAGSVRVPAAFCGIASIKPTSGRLPRTGHVPPAGGWLEAIWQIGPMARYTEDLMLAMRLLAREDEADFTTPPMPLTEAPGVKELRVAFFTGNGFADCQAEIKEAVAKCARHLEKTGARVTEKTPPGMDQAYDLEMAILGADGAAGIDGYLQELGGGEVHPLLTHFVDQMRPHAGTAAEFGATWARWDEYRANLRRFFADYDAILCPVYTQTALKHGESMTAEIFRGFSYTMAWNVAGAPAATVRCGAQGKLPINVQVVTKPWRDMQALAICRWIESEFGGWQQS